MKVPKEKTIRGRINFYAYKVGMIIVPSSNSHDSSYVSSSGIYHLFDIKMNYYTHKHLTMNDIVRVIQDELSMSALVSK